VGYSMLHVFAKRFIFLFLLNFEKEIYIFNDQGSKDLKDICLPDCLVANLLSSF
jgi:hypothetical protein